jgi:hypothetical protein
VAQKYCPKYWFSLGTIIEGIKATSNHMNIGKKIGKLVMYLTHFKTSPRNFHLI